MRRPASEGRAKSVFQAKPRLWENRSEQNVFSRRLRNLKSIQDVFMDTPDFRKSVWNLRKSTMTDVKDPSNTGGRLIAASKVNGTSVYNTAGEKLGSVYDVMLDKSTGKTEYAIMSFGGFLGIGDSYHPLPWHSLTYDEAHGGYVVNIDRSRLEGAPAYSASERDMWDDPDYGRRIDDYYHV
jgi:sporulation protein YlmC with PRC-barrel domain